MPRSIRVLLNHPFILKLSGFPLSLHFESFSVQLMSGNGLRSRPTKILGCSRRQVGIGMDYDKKYVGVLRELFMQKADEVQRRVAIIHCQRTPDAEHAGLLSVVSGTSWLAIACLSAEMLSRQRPCSARADCFLRS